MTGFNIEALDNVVRNSLREFTEDFKIAQWWGKEHDFVNRYVHGFLMKKCSPSSILAHPTQIGIEVGVAQPRNLFKRGAARKDLVIWPKPWMSCWNEKFEPVHFPMAVLEWKVVRSGPLRCHVHDRQWLDALAREREEFVGYSVTFNGNRGGTEQLLVVRFHRGAVDEEWMRL
jgi:hypothetical protein